MDSPEEKAMTRTLEEAAAELLPVTPEMVASLGGEDQSRSFLAALFIVQAELEQAGGE